MREESNFRRENVLDFEREAFDKLTQHRTFEGILTPIMDGLVDSAREDIKDGRWAAVIGDDRSARFPALVMQDILSRVAQQESRPAVPGYFIAAGKSRKGAAFQENLKARIQELKERVGDGRVLFVTDHIESGQTLYRLVHEFEKSGIAFDVMTLSRQEPKDKYSVFPYKKILPSDTKLYIGRDDDDSGLGFHLRMHRRAYVTAAQADINDTGLMTLNDEALSGIDTEASRDLVVSAREENKKLTDALYEKYFKNGTNN